MRWISSRGRVECNGDGKPVRMRGVSLDITARKQAEQELHERRGELAHLARVTMLGELSGSLAHELNQPLTAILSNAQAAEHYLAEDAPDLAQVREILADVVAEDERAGEVIRRLRLLLKKGEVQQQTLDVNEVVIEVLKLARSDLTSHGVIVDTDARVGPRGHPRRRRAAPAGAPQPRDERLRRDGRERREESASHGAHTLCRRSWRADRGQRCRARITLGRSGAGLRALFHDEGARPRARAVSLPHDRHGARRHARRDEQRRAWRNVSLHPAAGEGAPRMNERAPTVFVVDDDAAVRKAVARLLHSVRIEVAVFASPVEFLAAYDPEIPGCLLLDLEMPDLNGLELQQALTRRGGALPIIFLSAYGDVPISVRGDESRRVDFLTKPVRDVVLREAVRAAFEKDCVARLVRAERTSIEARLATLTPREHEVLEHVIAGQLNKQIAGDLGTVEHTIKVHRARVMEKMKVQSLAELVRFVERARAPRR